MFKNDLPDELLKKRDLGKHIIEDDPEIEIRGSFDRDFTAILYSSGFNRLKFKTQVFFDPSNDHLCSRMDHSLYVASIAESMCKILNNDQSNSLNIDMCRAIALGHDLGHPPFGHAGEKVIKKIDGLKYFDHKDHSFRFVSKLSNQGEGLNLTFAVKNGILFHTHAGDKYRLKIEDNDVHSIEKDDNCLTTKPLIWESCVIHFADQLANLFKDIADAYYLKLISKVDIQKLVSDICEKTFESDEDIHYKMNSFFIKYFLDYLAKYSLSNEYIGFSEKDEEKIRLIKKFKNEKIYDNHIQQKWQEYIRFVLETMYHYYSEKFLPFGFIDMLNGNYDNEITLFQDKYFLKYLQYHKRFYLIENDIQKATLDFIVGMTDRFAVKMFNTIMRIDNTPL